MKDIQERDRHLGSDLRHGGSPIGALDIACPKHRWGGGPVGIDALREFAKSTSTDACQRSNHNMIGKWGGSMLLVKKDMEQTGGIWDNHGVLGSEDL